MLLLAPLTRHPLPQPVAGIHKAQGCAHSRLEPLRCRCLPLRRELLAVSAPWREKLDQPQRIGVGHVIKCVSVQALDLVILGVQGCRVAQQCMRLALGPLVIFMSNEFSWDMTSKGLLLSGNALGCESPDCTMI